jgi:hypothetical protein
LLPSSGIIATDLNAEEGINYEAGIRGTLIMEEFILTLMHFALA